MQAVARRTQRIEGKGRPVSLATARQRLVDDVAAFVAAHPCAEQALFALSGVEVRETVETIDGPRTRTLRHDAVVAVEHDTDERGVRHVRAHLMDEASDADSLPLSARVRLGSVRGAR